MKPLAIPAYQNEILAQAVADRWDNVTKPPGSLGRLEELVLRYALVRGDAMPVLERKGMYIFCADHGVAAESISPFPSEITGMMVRNYLSGGAAISVMCRHYGIETSVIDCGVKGPCAPGAVDRRIAEGTANFVHACAMSREEAERALENGIELGREAAHRFHIAGVGEMGIGNTTCASALLCALSGIAPEEAAGRGAGLDVEGVARKARVIAAALALHQPRADDPIGALAAVGGFEVATMAGFLMGAASARLPVVVDGFIASSAALVALALAPGVREALFFAHSSAEKAHRAMLDQLQVHPILHLDMRLGEGTGSAIAVNLIECAVRLYREMATFQDLH